MRNGTWIHPCLTTNPDPKMKRSCFSIFLSICCLFSFAQEIRSVKVTDLERIIKESRKPLIINFWATWCRPCIEEIPWFQSEVAKHKDSVELLLVSLDFKEEFPEGIKQVALKRRFSAMKYWLNETNADYFCPKIDSSWTGSLPASLFINNQTGLRIFREEQIREEEFSLLIGRLLGRQ